MRSAMREKPFTALKYLCIWCDASFENSVSEPICPDCGNRLDLVPIYAENDVEEQQMHTADDYHGG